MRNHSLFMEALYLYMRLDELYRLKPDKNSKLFRLRQKAYLREMRREKTWSKGAPNNVN